MDNEYFDGNRHSVAFLNYLNRPDVELQKEELLKSQLGGIHQASYGIFRSVRSQFRRNV